MQESRRNDKVGELKGSAARPVGESRILRRRSSFREAYLLSAREEGPANFL